MYNTWADNLVFSHRCICMNYGILFPESFTICRNLGFVRILFAGAARFQHHNEGNEDYA